MSEPKQILVVRKDLKMSLGKTAAQVAHASLAVILDRAVYRTANSITIGGLNEAMTTWLTEKFTKIVVSVDSEAELLAIHEAAKKAGVPTALIMDEGRTEFKGVPTYTVCAVGPESPEKIDPLTRHLPLLR